MITYFIFNLLYSGIYDNDDAKITEILNSEIIKAALTPEETVRLFIKAQKMREAKSIDSFLLAAKTRKELMLEKFSVTADQMDNWEVNGLDDFAKEMLAFAIISNDLYEMRYHTCQYCGADYFSSDPDTLYCPNCYTDIIIRFLR